MQKGVYTEESIISVGKYKFTRIKNIPAEYLLKVYKNKGYPDKELLLYVENNIEHIKNKQENNIIDKKTFLCNKIVYPTKAEAQYVLREIRKSGQTHKKPIRAYECEYCGGWHHTSQPNRKWLIKNKPGTGNPNKKR